jgi:peptidoglycan/xylan/chitin deacetylase (PgdA/CDA1 family)
MTALARIALRLRSECHQLFYKKLIHAEIKRPVVSISFDDCPRSAVTTGARLLEEFGACGTFYVAGSLCGTVSDGIRQFEEEDISRLSEAGHEIGCHTFTHRPVVQMTDKTLFDDLEQNAAFVENIVPGLEMNTFAYPFGHVSLSGKSRLRHRFAACRGIEAGLNRGRIDLSYLKAVQLYESVMDEAKLTSLITQTVDRKAWLILFTHDVEDAPSRFGCSPSLLRFALTAAVQAGVDIMPIKNAIGEIRFNK